MQQSVMGVCPAHHLPKVDFGAAPQPPTQRQLGAARPPAGRQTCPCRHPCRASGPGGVVLEEGVPQQESLLTWQQHAACSGECEKCTVPWPHLVVPLAAGAAGAGRCRAGRGGKRHVGGARGGGGGGAERGLPRRGAGRGLAEGGAGGGGGGEGALQAGAIALQAAAGAGCRGGRAACGLMRGVGSCEVVGFQTLHAATLQAAAVAASSRRPHNQTHLGACEP